jgi:hypothetical protein
MQKEPTMSDKKRFVNVGTIGHIDHGKTTLTAALCRVAAESSKPVMSDKAIIRAEFEDWWDAGFVSGNPEEKHVAFTAWQAAKEQYAPKSSEVEVAARTGFRAGWCYSGADGIDMAETFARDYMAIPSSGDKE